MSVTEPLVNTLEQHTSSTEGFECKVLEPIFENNDDEDIPDIELRSVSDLQETLGNIPYETIRKALYKKYGLVTKDEESIPGLYMITYNKPDKYSKHKVVLTDEQKRVVDQYRGVIVEKDTNRPVCYTFEKMHRHFPEDWSLESCSITTSYDGSQIKIFYYNEDWVVSTTRRIDASKSYFFSNKSFMELWKESSTCLDFDKLNQNFCYSFVLSHPENRIVAKHSNPFITHVLTRDMTTFNLVSEDIGVPRPETVLFENKNEIWKSITALPYYQEGFVVKNGDCFIKLENSKYHEVKELRGNSSSLLFHYFKLKKDKQIRKFLKYYPEYSETFRYFESCFDNLCTLVYSEYVLLRIRKLIQPPQVMNFLKPVLYKLHGIHLSTKSRVKISTVKAHLQEYTPFALRNLVDASTNLPYSFH